MLIVYDASITGWERTWKGLGCGREVYGDAAKHAEANQPGGHEG
jgi:hypothetical protein